MRVGILGINHKVADIGLREALAKTFRGSYLLHEEHTFLLLTTCNRFEIYFASDDLTAAHSALLGMLRQGITEESEQKFYTYFEKDCFWHLSRVVSGLDSAILGESEIQGQIKTLYEKVREMKLPKSLHFLFQKSLKVGKEIRTKFPVKTEGIESLLFRLSGEKVLFVGASEINEKIIRYFLSRGKKKIYLCNRTEEKAIMMSEKLGIESLSFDQRFWNQDSIVLGTKAKDPLLLKAKNSQIIFDLGVPRNVLPSCPCKRLYDIDKLQGMLSKKEILWQAETFVAKQANHQATLFAKAERRALLWPNKKYSC
jgi:glutamyl-tRNA reductase